ncbi:MAG: CotH kinase family protein [Dysgonamonadaceae bacterium]|nr:CotH kinase family protein [Dysgonamonadaceae bacterium]
MINFKRFFGTNVLLYCILLAGTSSLSGCKDSEESLREILVEPETVTLEVGASKKIIAMPTPLEAKISEFTWVSANPSIATASNTGTIVGIAKGSTTVTVSSGSISKGVAVTVVAKALKSIEVKPESLSLATGQKATLSVTLTPSDADVSLSWVSDDPAIATVSSSGEVTAVADGSTNITVSAGSFTKKIPVLVNALTPGGTITAIGSGANPSIAFDNNTATAYWSNGDYQWVGLDLGAKYVINKIAYSPRQNAGPMMQLGVFEGANLPDFGDAIPIGMITDIPNNDMTTIDINVTRGFRYVRYVGPNMYESNGKVASNCFVSEIAFFGHQGNGDDSQLTQIAGIPIVVVHTTNAAEVNSKENYIKGIASFIYNGGKAFYSDSTEIRGRGNASWSMTQPNNLKKPYRIKLYNSIALMGNPAKGKSWTLINNWGDKTLMRNLLAFSISKLFEMPYTPAGQPVNVFYNGEYKGCYQLCDQIDVRKGRVDVKEMGENDISGKNLTGGYLIEIDAYANQEPANTWFTSAMNETTVTIKSPDVVYDNGITRLEQYNYIRDHFNKLEAALHADNYKDPADGYRKYLDTHTFIRHFLVGELSGNIDTYWSVYMYKQRENDIFYTGPVWDFDIAFDNDDRVYPINSKTDWLYKSGSRVTGMGRFVDRLFSDPEFADEVKSTYKKYRDSGAISEASLHALVDDYAAKMDESQRLNFTRWKIMSTKVHQNPSPLPGSYSGEVQRIKSFISSRIVWMDKFLEYK